MKITTLQWNIGGGKIRDEKSDPTLDESYNLPGIQYIVDVIQKLNPDIITFQETHSDNQVIQAEVIAKALNLPYFVNDEYDDSHIEKGQRLGQAILSKFPIVEHKFEFFHNPKYTVVQPNGETWVSHNKGITSCLVEVGGNKLWVQTLHLIPFRRFNVEALGDESKAVREDIATKISGSKAPCLLQGDFNFDNETIKNFLPDIFQTGLKEVIQDRPTTPNDRKYDHVLYKGIKLIESRVIDTVLTDHYSIYSEFEL